MTSQPAESSGTRDPGDTAEDTSGKKKSKLQTFRNFFVKKKVKENSALEGQSSEDVPGTTPVLTGATPVLTGATSVLTGRDTEPGSGMGAANQTRSHDCIVADDLPSSERNEILRSSQDGIHGKVKALQMQLKQAIRLGSPASGSRRKSDEGAVLYDDEGFPSSPQECSTPCTVLTASSQRSSGVVHRCSAISLEVSESDDEQTSGASSRSGTPDSSILVDFGQPASSQSCLDNSAAHHRIAIRAKACTKRKNRELRRRDLREKVLLRDAEDKLRTSRTSTEEEESKDDLEETSDMQEDSQMSSASSDDDHDDPACYQRVSTMSSSSSVGGDVASSEDNVDLTEIPQSSWENPITLELQTEDFLLDSGCAVVHEHHGSLLEEVLRSLMGPLTSTLALESKDATAQMKVEDHIEEDVIEVKKRSRNQTDSTDATLVLEKEMLPVQRTLSAMGFHQDSLEDLHEASQEDRELDQEDLANERLTKEEHEVENEEYELKTKNDEDQDEEIDSNKKHSELLEDAVGLEEHIDDEEVEKKQVKQDTSKNEEDAFEEQIKIQEQQKSKEEDNETDEPGPIIVEDQLGIQSDANLENQSFQKSDQTIEVSSLVSTEDLSQPEDIPESLDHRSFVVTTLLDLHVPSRTSNPPDQLKEIENEAKDFQKKVEEQNDLSEEDSSENHQVSSSDENPPGSPEPQNVTLLRFSSDEAPHEPVQEEHVLKESPSTEESAVESSNHIEKCDSHDQVTPENRFGVRLRRTAALHRYISGVETPTPSTEPEVPTSSFEGQPARRTSLPKKLEEPVEGGLKPRRVSDRGVGDVVALEISEGPSWISLARQKQKMFKENSLEESSQEDLRKEESPYLSCSLSKDHLKPLTSAGKGSSFLDVSKPAMEREKRSISPPALPLAPVPQEEPPWLALAKKKAKAWSEMPQIVQ